MKNWTPIVISGPTGCGKSALALELARLIDGEIVCADSRQIYEGMRIGAAGPSEAELRVVPHHLFHVVDPKQLFDAGQYRTRCTERIADIQSRMRTPIVVGGTGLYLRALRFGLEDVPGKDDVIRDALNAQLESEGLDALHLELARVDPQTAALVAPQDPIRILRALELFRITGTKASTLRQSHGTKIQLQAIWINLQLRRDLLLKRLENRALGMWTGGLIDEAVALKRVLGDAHPLLKRWVTKRPLSMRLVNYLKRPRLNV